MIQKPNSPSPTESSAPKTGSVAPASSPSDLDNELQAAPEPWWFAQLDGAAQGLVRDLWLKIQQELIIEHKAAARYAGELANLRIILDNAKGERETYEKEIATLLALIWRLHAIGNDEVKALCEEVMLGEVPA